MKKSPIVVSMILLLLLFISAIIVVPLVREYLYPREYSEYVSKYASEYSVPESMIYAVIYTESSFNENAVSYVGAKGLMQLMPDTLDWLSRVHGEDKPSGDITDPETNIKYGTFYLGYLYERFGSWESALAAYNAGHNRIAGWLKDTRYSDDGINLKEIPIQETKDYVNRVLSVQVEYSKIYYNGEN